MDFRTLASDLLLISEDCLPVESIHGLLTAIVIGPVSMDSAEWLPLVFGRVQDLPEFPDLDTRNRIMRNLSSMENEILEEVHGNTWNPLILGIETANGVEFDAEPWCAGFLLGVNMHRGIWLTAEHRSLFDSMMPIFFLTYPEKYSEIIEKHTKKEVESMKQDFMDELTDLIPAIARYWQKHS